MAKENPMTINTVTHLNFRGDARAALAFYHSVFGGNQMLISYADAHNVQKPAEADQIMWGQVAADNGFHVMAYDVPSATPWNAGEIPFFVSIRGEDRYGVSCLRNAMANVLTSYGQGTHERHADQSRPNDSDQRITD